MGSRIPIGTRHSRWLGFDPWLLLLVIGGVIGSGIFKKPGLMATQVGSGVLMIKPPAGR